MTQQRLEERMLRPGVEIGQGIGIGRVAGLGLLGLGHAQGVEQHHLQLLGRAEVDLLATDRVIRVALRLAHLGRKVCLELLHRHDVRSDADMERVGIAADVVAMEELEADFAAKVREAQGDAYDAIGGEQINLGSPKQLQVVLFDTLGMPKTKKTKTGYTTDADALTDLYARTEHPFLEALLRHRDASRLRVTVEGLLKSVADDGRIHTTYQQTIAATDLS